MKKILVPCALLLLSLLFCALLAEGALRLLGYDPMGALVRGRQAILRESSDPILKFDLRPNARGRAWHTEVEINDYGTRDRRRSADLLEPSDAYRIVALGDSVTFGSGVKEEERFTEKLESELASRLGRPVEVLNFGIGGYDTLQEVVLLEQRALRFSPDLVLLAYCLNDVGDNSPNRRYLRRLDELGSPLYALRTVQFLRSSFDRIRLMRWLDIANRDDAYRERNREFIAPITPDRELESLRSELRKAVEAGGVADFRIPWYLSDAHLGKLEFALARLGRLSMEHDFDVVVAILPALERSQALRWTYAIVEHMADRHDLRTVRLDSILEGRDPVELRLRERDIIHPNARGHRLIAETLSAPLGARLVSSASGPD